MHCGTDRKMRRLVRAVAFLSAVAGLLPGCERADKGRPSAAQAPDEKRAPDNVRTIETSADAAEGKGEGVIKEEDKKALKKAFEELQNDVKLLMFTQETECEFCSVTREIVEEVAALSEKITAEVRDFVKDAELAKKHGVDKIPAIVLIGEKDYGIRFFGVPAGYEFATLIQDIVDVSRRDPGLPKEVLDELAKVDKPVHMQVMISPTCPYCPRAVRTAHRFAMASEHITADMVEISEFPHLAVKYQVQGVPKTVINEEHSIVGAQPEMESAKAVLRAIGK